MSACQRGNSDAEASVVTAKTVNKENTHISPHLSSAEAFVVHGGMRKIGLLIHGVIWPAAVQGIHIFDVFDAAVQGIHIFDVFDAAVQGIHIFDVFDAAVQDIHIFDVFDASVQGIHIFDVFDAAVRGIHIFDVPNFFHHHCHTTTTLLLHCWYGIAPFGALLGSFHDWLVD